MEEMCDRIYIIIALDLEGTLISNAISIFPRPGLHEFLRWCYDRFERVVLFTAVNNHRARWVVQLLAEEGTAPKKFGGVEIIDWSGDYKDLRFVAKAEPDEILIVDDQERYILPEQRDQWIEIEEFVSPYEQTDEALVGVRKRISRRLAGDE
jgi:hypothetical protein